jgi:hypothetical protein
MAGWGVGSSMGNGAADTLDIDVRVIAVQREEIHKFERMWRTL